MQSLSKLIIGVSFLTKLGASETGYNILGAEPGAWPQILSSIGLLPSTEGYVTVARPGTAASPKLRRKVQDGAILVLEGTSPLAASFGFTPGDTSVSVASMWDVHAPKLPLILLKSVEIAHFTLPLDAQIFTKDRWSDTPLVAGLKLGKGAILWLAIDPGWHGYEKFPYLPQALTDLGYIPPFQTRRTWAFFDYSYRTRVDVDYFAAKWRKAGISALHVSAWHFYDADITRDDYLRHLIEACHREGILIYAWIELPHVSEKFWTEHPDWREKTATLQDAALDWRKLMNLTDPDCFKAVSVGINSMMHRFNWDGVNLAELYFESLEGASNPAHFTPLNSNVRHDFLEEHGFDPVELWSTRRDAASLRTFLDYRAGLARQMQVNWLAEMERCKEFLPDLDIVLTHVDDRLDTGMTDAIGANSSYILPLLNDHNFTFMIEDPATVWNLGPQRYPEIARRYPASPKLAIDINVVDRYQDVYPTKQQTGTELFELVHLASASFPRVAVYFESSISDVDLALLPASSAVVTRYLPQGGKVLVDSHSGFVLQWEGPAKIDGKLWAAGNEHELNVPAGAHTLEPATEQGMLLTNFNGDLHTAHRVGTHIELSYSSSGRALAEFSCEINELKVDGVITRANRAGRTLLLPSGNRTAIASCK